MRAKLQKTLDWLVNGPEQWGRWLGKALQGEEQSGSGRAVYHGQRVLLLLVLSIGINLLFPVSGGEKPWDLRAGMLAPEDIRAPFTFTVAKSEAELTRERETLAATVPPVFRPVPGAQDSILGQIEGFFSLADSLRKVVQKAGPSQGRADRFAQILIEEAGALGIGSIVITPEAARLLLDPQASADLAGGLRRFVNRELQVPIVGGDDLVVFEGDRITLVADGEEETVSKNELLTEPRLFDRALEWAQANLGSWTSVRLFHQLLANLIRPTILYDELETQSRREIKRQEVSPIKYQVLEGEKIVGASERITQVVEEKLRVLREEVQRRAVARDRTAMARPYGGILFNFFVLFVFGLYLYLYRPDIYRSARRYGLIALAFALVALEAALVRHLGFLPKELILFAAASILIAVLLDGRVAVVSTIVLSVLIGGQGNFGLPVTLFGMLGGMAGALSVRVIRRRTQFYESLIYILLGNTAAVLTLALMEQQVFSELVQGIGYGAANAGFCTILAIGLLPVLEMGFDLTTDITLLELSDLNRPLLKQLALKAPGTYHHSILVGNLAEAAAEAIGANSLLARVGAYYHDIGKMENSLYFVENQRGGRNPHDTLKPSMSALIIVNHVKEGVKMAREADLPEAIVQFIPQHHGTARVSYFYEKALQQTEPTREEVEVEEYRYPGPNPQIRETAVVMLADTVESASRTLADPSPSRIRGLVERLVARRVAEGQFEECDLTLRDLAGIRETLIEQLTGMFHARIDYPLWEEERREREQEKARERTDRLPYPITSET